MTRTFSTLILLQAVALEPSLTQVLVQLPMVAVVVWLWIRDQNRREAQQKASDERYSVLVDKVVQVVEENAKTAARLQDALMIRPCMRVDPKR